MEMGHAIPFSPGHTDLLGKHGDGSMPQKLKVLPMSPVQLLPMSIVYTNDRRGGTGLQHICIFLLDLFV